MYVFNVFPPDISSRRSPMTKEQHRFSSKPCDKWSSTSDFAIVIMKSGISSFADLRQISRDFILALTISKVASVSTTSLLKYALSSAILFFSGRGINAALKFIMLSLNISKFRIACGFLCYCHRHYYQCRYCYYLLVCRG